LVATYVAEYGATSVCSMEFNLELWKLVNGLQCPSLLLTQGEEKKKYVGNYVKCQLDATG